jgi:hypothetical protein
MATLAWNVKLLGNLTPQDFSVWKAAAKIPECYTFNITSSADGWGEYPELQEGTVPIPNDDNTIIIVGKDQYNLFEPYCFAGHKCVMNTEPDDYATGTKILSTIMTSDGMLDKSVIDAITDKIDMDAWIRKYAPEAAHCLDNMSVCTDPTTGYLNSTGDAVKLENAIDKYILSSLGVCQTPSGGNILPPAEKPSETAGIPKMYYVAGVGAIVAAGLGYYIWKKMKEQH